MLFNFICRRISSHSKLHINSYNALSSSSSPFSTTPSDSSNQHSFTVNYLINSCGLSPESAILASKHVNLSEPRVTANSVIEFLTNQGFTKSEVSSLIIRHPKILSYDPEQNLLPVFQTLKLIGISNTNLAAVVNTRPKELIHKWLPDKALSSVKYLKSVLKSDEKVIHAIKRYPMILTYDLQLYAAGNIQILRELGVSESTLVSLFSQQPRTFLTSVDRFSKVVNDVKEMGFNPSKIRFLWAVHAVRSMSRTTWDKKVELYKKFGWSDDEIITAFERHPGCMMASIGKINRILDFLVNKMGWESSFILKFPIVICFSFEKRIVPRCLVYQYLAEKGLTGDEFYFTKWLMYSDSKFLKWIVEEYKEESEELVELYQKHLGSSVLQKIES